ncbi:putative zinc-type alcohol dehydrogenase-like protein [Saccharopolyspora erythraea NRRL 2338]|uniref:alcohol dehydrogenase (NADP(+)) n=2 Tax=Saccharopolyspora erythraea TaxID=1836 RepID=A4FD10_SACEN|nr:alcohol dehydrogenase [Saccharopolyspora erythraea D]PFG95683.1 putative zinc-type alcohol dehydrogenase-like protein [Saccharopolyspora erythraea NRRL 2338]CAM01935.1 alcohol dehydrogenase, zinc-binding [Saccharopolyspora erythraea NRRL 2338]
MRRWNFHRRDLRDDDVAVRILYCGVCHSDLDAIDHGDRRVFPLVPGHEFVGEVVATGAAVTRFAAGDRVAVGNIVDSCGVCEACSAGQENYCARFPTLTYGGADRHDRTQTQGGYSAEYVVAEKFAYRVPGSLDLAGVAPLMCAGVTVWEPLRRWSVDSSSAVGVVGLGGLGHLAVKLAHALGAEVAVFTTSAAKTDDARELGADDVIVSGDADRMAAQANRFDLILDTASAAHDLSPYLRAVRMDGTLCCLGMTGSLEFDPLSLLIGRKSLASAGSGGTTGTQDMLDFCGEHGITATVEVLPAHQVNNALDRLRRNDVRYRFALDMHDHEHDRRASLGT